jgi:hypothetical protein
MTVATTPIVTSPIPHIVGDPKAGTRLAGKTEWVLAPGGAVGSAYASLGAAVSAAQQLSSAGSPAVAILQQGAQFALHEIGLGHGPQGGPAPQLAPFALDAKTRELLSSGGYLDAAPVTPLVGLVDDDVTLRIATDTSTFTRWGFEPGISAG